MLLAPNWELFIYDKIAATLPCFKAQSSANFLNSAKQPVATSSGTISKTITSYSFPLATWPSGTHCTLIRLST